MFFAAPDCRSLLAVCLVASNVSLVCAADPVLWEITVNAGEHDRVGTPVRVALEVPAELRSATSALLQGSDDAIPCQLTAAGLQAEGDAASVRELHFVVPSLKAGTSTTLRLTLGGDEAKPAESSSASRQSFAWADGKPGETELTFAGQGVLRYVHPTLDETDAKTREATYKPFHHVYAPDGSRVVTKGPGGQFTHHRGLYFGFNRITYGDDQKCDVWHCRAPAYQAHEKSVAKEEGFVVGRQHVQIGWHGAKGERFADEQRELTVYNAEPGQYIEFASTVSTPDKPIRLDGDPQHAGFHFRADNEVAEKTKSQTYYIRPDGQDKPGATRNWDAKSRNPKAVNEPWKVLSFVLGDRRYSALYLDHPSNPKEARSSERDYGRFGSYFEYDISSDKPLSVRYRLILRDGEFTADEARRLSADFVSPPEVAVRKL